MDILLVNAPVNLLVPHAQLSRPLGLAYIGAVLLKTGYSVSAIDLNTSDTAWPELKKTITDSPPSILGISAYTETYLNALQAARIAKTINPGIKVVIGGPHASILYHEAAQEACIDTVVIGEGEQTMLELADYFIKRKGILADIKGIAYKENGLVKVTQERLPIADLDTLPFPARYLFPSQSYTYPISILASRGGCPFACHFCAVNNIWKGKRRFRKPEKVADEIFNMLITLPRGSIIDLADDTFTLDRECVLKLCKILQDGSQYLGNRFPLSWQCATRVDLVDTEILRQMHFAGCCGVQYGIESGSQKILDSIGKKIRLEQVQQAIRNTLDYGMAVTCSFMFPQPDDTEETIKKQIGLMKDLKNMGATLTLTMTTPYPGTYYYEHAAELGIEITDNSWDMYDCQHLIITTKYLGAMRLKDLLKEMVTEVGLKQEPITKNI